MKEVLEDLGALRSMLNDWRARRQAPRYVKLPGGQLRVPRIEYEAWCCNALSQQQSQPDLALLSASI